MLHMILGILKVIGLIAGILFLLLLAIALAVVFVPVRYQLAVKALPERHEFSLKGSWLLHVVSASVSVDPENGRKTTLRLFGIPLPLFRHGAGQQGEAEPDEPETDDAPAEVQDEPEKAEEIKSGSEEKETGKEKDKNKKDRERTGADEQPGTGKEQDSEAPDDTEQNDAGSEQADRNILQKIWFQCRRICGKIKQIIQRILQAVKGFRQKLAGLKQSAVRLWHRVAALLRRPGELRDFIEEYELREVLGGLTGHLLFLIGHYKPRRIRGYLRFGTDDPSVTGQLTGLIYMLLPARADRYSVEPEFNKTIFETETICSGRIRALHVLRVLWRAFRDKKLRRVINRLRKRGDS